MTNTQANRPSAEELRRAMNVLDIYHGWPHQQTAWSTVRASLQDRPQQADSTTPTPNTVSTAEELLDELREYFEDRADAEYSPDRAAPVGNEEMRLLGVVEQLRELAALKSQQGEEKPSV